MIVDVLSGVSRNAGGLFYSVRWLSQALAEQDVAIRLISHVDEFSSEDLPAWAPLEVELHSAHGPLLSSSRLRGILSGSNADLLHVHGLWLDRQWAALQWQSSVCS